MTVEAALLVGHLLGDWIVQTHWQAMTKVHAGRAGARALAHHMLGYHVTLLVVLALAGHAHDATAVAVMLGVSAATHALIDRRWPVRWLLQVTGSAEFARQPWGVLVVDQVLHISILLACAALW